VTLRKSYGAGVAARIIVLALAVVLAGFAALQMHDSRRCRTDSNAVLRLSIGAKDPISPGLAESFIEDCPGSHLLAIAASVLARKHRLPQAIRLSDEAIRREPSNYEGWLALSETLRRRGLDAAAKRAFAHVRRLNPRYGQPLD
jgi:hypothetical protein